MAWARPVCVVLECLFVFSSPPSPPISLRNDRSLESNTTTTTTRRTGSSLRISSESGTHSLESLTPPGRARALQRPISQSATALSPDVASSGAVLQCVVDGADLKLRPVWIADPDVPFEPALNAQARVPHKVLGHFYHVHSLRYEAAHGRKPFYRAAGALTDLGDAWIHPNDPQNQQQNQQQQLQHNQPPSSSPSGSTLSNRPDASASRSIREIDYGELNHETKPVGSGAYGVVYRGIWRGAQVAIKKLIIDGLYGGDVERLLEEFHSEIGVMNLIGDHPNVIRLIGVCSKAPNLCLVTPWVTHGSLEDLLFKKREQLPLKTRIRVARDIAAGILHLHFEGIIHRDLALRNVLIGENYSVYVNDFGLSRLKNQEQTYAKTQSSFGPVKNMAPEAIVEKKYSEKSDAYSYGILLWQLWTVRQPYEDMDAMQVVMYVAREKHLPALPLDPDIHPDIAALITSCTEFLPEKRPSFQEISNDLSMLLLSV